MKRIVAFLLLGLSSLCCAAAETPLIANGRSEGAILIPEKANSVERTAAQELQYHLKEMTGVTLPIVSAPDAKYRTGYKLGRAAGFTFTKADRPDTWKSRLKDGFLEIAGVDGNGAETESNNPAGTIFGVYHYLQKGLGIHWLWPGKLGEFIPHRDKVVLADLPPLNFDHQLRHTCIFISRKYPSPLLYRWCRRNMNMRTCQDPATFGSGHAFGDWPDRYGKEHPEWFALKNGKRTLYGNRTNVCVSNPEFRAEIVRRWAEAEARKKAPLTLSLGENDSQNYCECDACRSWDGPNEHGPTARYQKRNVSQRYQRFDLEVWKLASRIRPDVDVTFHAYRGFIYGPRKIKFNRHFKVKLVPDIPFPRTPAYTKFLRHEYDLWAASGVELILRPNYFHTYVMPEVWYDEFADEFQYLRKCGLVGYFGDATYGHHATSGLNFYVMIRLTADPDADPEKLKDDYVSSFGPAAPAVREYLDFWHRYHKVNAQRINDHWEHTRHGWNAHGWVFPETCYQVYPEKDLTPARKFLDKAAKLAGNDKDAAAKVAFLRGGLEHAIIATRTSALFADKNSTAEQRMEALKQLKAFRDTLQPFSYCAGQCWRGESIYWRINGKRLEDLDNIPIEVKTKKSKKKKARKGKATQKKTNAADMKFLIE